MGRKQKAMKKKEPSRLHGRESLAHTELSRKGKVAEAKPAPVKKEKEVSGVSAPVESEAESAQQRNVEEKDLVHKLVPILMDKRREYLKESRGASAANTSRVIAQLHEEIGESMEAATAFVAAAQEALGATEIDEEKAVSIAKESFADAARNYELAGKPHKAQWANEQAEKAGEGAKGLAA
jgi:hypothetical protein